MMTVVAIIGITAAIAIPYFNFTPDSRLKSAADDIAGILSNARMTAVANNATETVKFDDAADTVYFNAANNSNNCDWNGKVDIFFYQNASGPYNNLYNLSDIQGPERWVQFSPMGVPVLNTFTNPEESVFLQYKNDPKTKIYKVTVEKYTGMITITYWDGASWASLY